MGKTSWICSTVMYDDVFYPIRKKLQKGEKPLSHHVSIYYVIVYLLQEQYLHRSKVIEKSSPKSQ